MSSFACATHSEWASLLDSARAGDSHALGILCERMRDYLLLTATQGLDRGMRAKFGASDIVQRTFVEVQRDFAQFRGSCESEFRSWLVRLVEHNLVDAVRQFRQTQKRDTSREVSIDAGQRQRELVCPQGTPSSLARRREMDEELLRAVARLPDRAKRIIELRHRQGLNFAEIGIELEMTEVAARKFWSRTVESLRGQVAKQDGVRRTRPR